MVALPKLYDPMDPKILPVSYKDKLVGRDEQKKVSGERHRFSGCGMWVGSDSADRKKMTCVPTIGQMVSLLV